jgi:hypothetical protein
VELSLEGNRAEIRQAVVEAAVRELADEVRWASDVRE